MKTYTKTNSVCDVWWKRKMCGVWAIVGPISLADCVLRTTFLPFQSALFNLCYCWLWHETIHQTIEWNTCSILFAVFGLISCNKLPFNVLLHNSARLFSFVLGSPFNWKVPHTFVTPLCIILAPFMRHLTVAPWYMFGISVVRIWIES